MDFSQLIDLTPDKIALVARDPLVDGPVRFYARVTTAYLTGDNEGLEALCEEIRGIGTADLEDPRVWKDIETLTLLRLDIRKRCPSKNVLETVARAPMKGALQGEKYFLLGLAWEIVGDHIRAADLFSRASAQYSRSACPQKSLRSSYNAIASERRAHPDKNFVLDYQSIISRAQELEDFSFAGMTMMTLSREYQIAGLHDKALDMAAQSLEHLTRERGTLHYFHAVLHRAHLLIEAERIDEARLAIEETKLASFPEIAAVRELLLWAIDPSREWDPLLEQALLPTWRARVPTLLARKEVKPSDSAKAAHSDLEERFLRNLWNSPPKK